MKYPSRRPFRIARSRTGLGLFATAPIRNRQFIARYWGRKIPNAVSDALDSRYMFEINSRWTIDGSTRRNLARYANHSCRPNAESDVIGHKVIIRARRNIKPGDEITYDYGKDYIETFFGKNGCRCDKCRERRAEARAARQAKKLRAERRAAAAGKKRDIKRSKPRRGRRKKK